MADEMKELRAQMTMLDQRLNRSEQPGDVLSLTEGGLIDMRTGKVTSWPDAASALEYRALYIVPGNAPVSEVKRWVL